jgi:hypothetical protein
MPGRFRQRIHLGFSSGPVVIHATGFLAAPIQTYTLIPGNDYKSHPRKIRAPVEQSTGGNLF